MRLSVLPFSLRILFCSVLLLFLAACGKDDDDDDDRVQSAQSGVFVDSAVNGLAYSTVTRSGLTGTGGVDGRFTYLSGERVSFRLDCIRLGSATGRAIISPRTLLGDTTAAINMARLLLSLDEDGNPAVDGIDVGHVDIPAALCDIDFANFPEADVEEYVQGLIDNNEIPGNQDPSAGNNAVVTHDYAEAHLDCTEDGGTYFNGVCSTDEPVISVGDAPAVLEGNSGTTAAVFTITRNGDASGISTVRVSTADGTATVADNDYEAVTGVLVTFAPNQVSREFGVTINGDTAVEPNETFTLNLSEPTNGVIGDGTGTATITNDDAAPGVSLFSIDDVSATEGNSGTKTFTFTVTRAGDTSTTASVTAATADDSATVADNDYEPVAATVLSFAPIETTKTINVTVNGDTTVEANEQFFVNLSNAGGNTITDSQGVGTIENDDTPPPAPTASFAADVTANEGDEATTTPFNFVVTLSSEASDEVVITYRAIGSETESGLTATAGQDFTGVSNGTLTIAAGQTNGTITINVIGDAFQENDETFAVEITGITNASIDDGVAIGTIVNDDTITLLMAGAAKRSVTPTDAQIAGQSESYQGGTRIQRFHLGGFGFGPFKFVPSFGGATPEINFDQVSNPPARARCFSPAITGANPTPANCEDDTWVRVLILQEPNDGDRVAFVVLDAVGAGNLIQTAVKTAINEASCEEHACITPENILFGQTHSHAGADLQGLWGGVPREWINLALVQGAADAAREAIRNSKPASLEMARGYDERFNNYRRPRYRTNEPHEADITMTLLQATAADGSGVIGTIMQYAAHPTAIGAGDFNTGSGVVRVPHPDYPLGAEKDLEATFGGTALYYNGPIADASASGGPGGVNAYDSVRNRGDAMATAARAFLSANAVTLDPVIETRSVEVTLPITNPLFLAIGMGGVFNGYYQFTEVPFADIPGFDQIPAEFVQQFQEVQNQLPQPTPVARTLLSRVSLGTPDSGDATKNRLEIVTIPGEATNTFGQYIRQLANEDAPSVLRPKRHTMLLGLTHNSFGYIIPEEEFSYVDPSGDAGFVAPFTGYEEFVSLGPLTAPLLRIEGYNVLFDVAPEQNLPPWLTDCFVATDHRACIIGVVQDRIAQILGGPAALFEAAADGCRELGGPDELCSIFDSIADTIGGGGGGVPGVPGAGDAALLPDAVTALLQGCDMLDPAHCLFPFPSDHLTVAAPAGSPQHADNGGTGRRVNFNILGMPRNIAGKPIDPTEWNRNDGFSPGAMVMAFVPGLAANEDGTIPGAPPITDIGQSLNMDSPVLVLDAETGEPHPVWAEIDLNAGLLLPSEGVANPDPTKPKRPALIIRPAKNFLEGHRYVVVLRNLQNAQQQPIAAGQAFTVCRDEGATGLPPLTQRCAALEESVFPVLDDAGIARDENLYLAWDFTVASAKNNTSRLVHMRDDAFRNVLGDEEDGDGNIVRFGRAPSFAITEVRTDGIDSRLARVVKGSFTIPSYVTPADASPLDGQAEVRNQLRALAAQMPAEFNEILDQCDDADPTGLICDFLNPNEAIDLASAGSLPPNRLFYNPTDAVNPADPQSLPYGDGLPDRNPAGEMTATFTCNVPKSAVDNPGTARPSLYGHGLLGGQGEGGIGGGGGPVTQMGGEHNMMFCATDWFGFATGDVPNVASVLIDISNFPVVPDASQQGMLNFMFLARLMAHPNGFAGDPAFQVNGQPVFDRREVFYDGNSQGGILGGPVIAVSKDVNRGVLGVPAQNYSTLLTRSVDFDIYSIPLYLAYQDDLDRDLGFALIQMLWDRSENNGYAQHMTSDALGGPDNQILLHPAFADHQVSHWAAQVMARSLDVEVADLYPRKASLGECGGNVQFCYADGFAGKQAFFDERDPDVAAFWDLPLVGRDPGAAYDDPGCPLFGECRTAKSAFVEFDKGETATPPIGNVPPRADGFDPHSFPRATRYGNCQKSHFLHTQGRIIDVRDTRNVVTAADCPVLPPAVGTPLDGGEGGTGVELCVPDAIPGIGGECIDVTSLPLIGAPLAALLVPVDDIAETIADECHNNAGPLEPACAVTDAIAQLINDDPAVVPPPVAGNNASCATGSHLARGGHYQVTIPSESGEVISFEVFEPTNVGGISCIADGDSFVGEPGAHPLILQGHGFGGSRSKGDGSFSEYRSLGYAVISIDQRGFGQSTGTVRTMDPDYEGKDLVRILDWAEQNLDYLAYRDEGTGQFVARPDDGASDPGGDNLVVGAIGGSYGGGFQFLLHNVDDKDRLDALAPDITWHDLRYSLNPGDTLKSAFGLLLTAGGESGSYRPGVEGQEPEFATSRGIDPFIKEVLARAVVTGEFPREALEWFRYHSPTYWCDLNNEPKQPYPFADWGDADPNTMLGTLAGDVPGSNRRMGQPGVDILLSQGFRDNLFNFNEAWWNYQCARVRGGNDTDVRLLTHQSGHILNLGGLTGQPLPPGTPLDVQTPGTTNNCGGVNRGTATVQWFNEKLRNLSASAELGPTNENKLCLSLSDNDAIFVPEEHLLAPMAQSFAALLDAPPAVEYYQIGGVGAASVPQGVLALTLHNAGQLSPSVVPLLSVGDANGLIVAGIPQATFTVKTPAGVNDAACEAGANVPSLRTGCDSIIYVGLGKKISGSSAWVLIDDQVTPVRGLGAHDIEMVGVGERLAQGDQLALLIYGFHPQYIASYSRDPSIPVVNVEVDLGLPLYGVVAGGAPDFFNPAGASVNGIATGTGCTDPSYTGANAECIATGSGENVVRQLCDYQWLPGVCEQFAQPDPGYNPDAPAGDGFAAAVAGYDDTAANGLLTQMVGAVHEHSGYSDGDPAMIPRDYFRAGRTGVNEPGRGVKLDFMWSSEHSDNEKLPITTSAACIPFGADVFENPEQIADADSTALARLLSCKHIQDSHHHFKWLATLEQAMAETERDEETGAYTGFTGIRGFEWTNDYYNHMNVYFSTNVVNVKVDGSYLSMDVMWNWLRRPVAEGGGADALVTFNHPGGDPALTPFDGGQPHNELLAVTRGGSNWNDVAYVPDVDERVAGMEVNGGDDIEWYVKALTKGWHLGPLTNEDEHGRNWSSHDQGKTLILTRGRSPQDYYYAFQNHRTVAIRGDLVSGAPGTEAVVPQVHYWTGSGNVQQGTPLGASVTALPGSIHNLRLDIEGMPAGYKVALISNTTGGQANPIQLGSVNPSGQFNAVRQVTAPAVGEDWYFAVVCPASAANCGSDQNYSAVTAPIWFGQSRTHLAFDLCVGGFCVSDIPVVGPLLLTALNEVDNTLDTLAGSCHANAGPFADACVVTDTLAGLIDTGGLPAGILPDQCDPSGIAPDGSRCLSDLPEPVGDLFAANGGGGDVPSDYATCVAMAQQGGAEDHEASAKFACAVIFGGGREDGDIQGPNTYVAMADGTLIATNVYIPWSCNVALNPEAVPCASVLEMSGYESGSADGQTPAGDLDDVFVEEFGQGGLPLTGGTRASHNKYYKSGDRYVSVTANVRGTGCSAGEFDLFSRASAQDGYELVEWMADQPWSNGKVGIFGHSYSGITGAMIASTNPPSLKMVSISGQIGDIYRDIVYPGGVSNYGFPLLWTGAVRPAYDYLGGTFAGLLADTADRQCAQNQLARSRTITEDPLINGLSDTDGPWYQARSVVNYLQDVTAPTQIVTAYQDEQTGPRGGTHVFDYLPQNLTRRLVMLNGDHGTQTGPSEVTAERRFWMDRFLLDANDPIVSRRPRSWSPGNNLPAPAFADNGTATSRVLLEVNEGTRSNGHIDSTGFPLAQTQWTDLFFQAGGALSPDTPTVEHGAEGSGSSYFSGSKRQAYSYQAGKNQGAEISAPDANGADELIFTLDIDAVAQPYGNGANKAFVIAGPVTADLYLSSTGVDTELMVQLIDADPATGERLYLQRGVLKASHREIDLARSQCAQTGSGGRITDRACTALDNIYRPYRPHVNPVNIAPGEVTHYRLEIFPVGHVLREGHQLLVKVHAPSLDDNDWAYIPKTAPAINTLQHSAEYPSSLRLPVIPLADVQRLGGPTGTCTDNQMRCVFVEEPGALNQVGAALGGVLNQIGNAFGNQPVSEHVADVLPASNPWLTEDRRLLNISHRGGADEYPENTLFAYAKSLSDSGSDMIEADVYQTADGELVVIHDASVDRTTNGTGAVNTMTLAQLKALDAAHWFVQGAGSNRNSAGPHPYRGIATGAVAPPADFSANDFKIPTLRELLARFPNTLINLELKPDERGAGSYEGKMAALLAEFGRTDDVIIASFLDTASAAFKAQAPQVSTSVPTGQVALAVATGQGPANGLTIGHEAFQVPIEFNGVPVTNQEFVDDAHARGLAVHVWTIDNPQTMIELLCMGVDGIMTDRPSVLKAVLESNWEASCDSSPPAAGTSSPGLLGVLGDYLSGLGHALLLALAGDMPGAQAQFLAAVGGLADGVGALLTDDPGYSLVASLERLGDNLAAAVANLADDPGSTPVLVAGAVADARNDAGRLAGLSRVVPDAEGACAPDNSQWADYGTYRGSLHEHSGYSDGAVGTTPASYFAQAKNLGMDFIGSSEHSDNALIPVTASQDCLSADFADCFVPLPSQDNPAAPVTKWQLTLQQARAASDANFTAFRGFEWTSDRFGHINVFFSRHDFNAKSTEGYTLSMESFWTWFATRPESGGGADGLAVFNHPGREDQVESNGFVHDPAYAFNGFEYRPAADLRTVGIEVFGKSGDAYDTDNGAPAGGWYAYALDRGWHVGAVGAEDEHGTSWAQPNRAKTLLIARDRSEGALREAMFARRFYALSQNHNDIRLSLTADGQPMGARLARAEGAPVLIEAAVTQAMPAGARLELVSNGGQVVASSFTNTLTHGVSAASGERWYYLRVLRADDRPVAYSSPVWIRGDGGEYPVCGEWLAGDLHVHTTYSHDAYGGPNEIAAPLGPVAPGIIPGDDNTGPDEFYTFGHTVERQFLIGAARGLDYLAITDHNDIRSQNDPGFGMHGVIALPSYENSLSGHAQMHGARRIYNNGQPLQALADELRADGGVFQVNHPAGESVDWHADADWGEARDGSYDGDVVPDTVEVWNISWLWQPPAPSGNSLDDAVRYWEGWLDRGEKVGLTGGSDNHYVATTPIQGVGQPTTWVFATERSARGVIEGLRRGRTSVSHQPPLLSSPRIRLEADSDGDGIYEALQGDEVPSGAALRVRVSNAAGGLLRVVTTGGVQRREPIPAFTPEFEYRFSLPAGVSWVRAEVVEPDAAAQRATVCDAAAGDQTTYCRNRLGVLAMSSALYLQ